MYRAFSATELGIIGGFIKKYAHIEVPERTLGLDQKLKITGTKIIPFPAVTNEFDLVRPYTPLERFIEAVKFLSVTKKVRFENAIFHANNNKIETVANFDMKRQNASKAIYDRIIGWDEPFMDELAEKYKGVLEGQLHLTPSPAPPLFISSSISDLELMAQNASGVAPIEEAEAETLTFQEEAQPATKKRGRPAKVS